MKYIHYGHSSFSKEQFQKIENHRQWIKPKGGLWGSQIFNEYGWKQWCLDNNFRPERLKEYFCFILTKEARLLKIKQPEDLDSLPRIKGTESFEHSVFLDYEKLCEDYDAIEVFFNGDLDFQADLCGWDCNSILVLNPEVVREVPKYEYDINGTRLFVEDLVIINNYYQAACTAEYLIENYPEFDTLEKAMSAGYRIRGLMLYHDYSESEAIDYYLSRKSKREKDGE
ncbi:MAG: hypothetical protein IJT79_05150 [Ruminococcus sp.]|nr:hypothetical protein [Ruminococcus sp.]